MSKATLVWAVEVAGWPRKTFETMEGAREYADRMAREGYGVTRYAPCDGVTCYGERAVTWY